MYADFAPTNDASEPTPHTVRRATVQDAEAIAGIKAQRNGSHAADLVDRVRSALNGGFDKVWVAEVAGQVCAYGKVAYIDPERQARIGPASEVRAGFHLMGVVVDAAYRRGGLGLSLTTARVRWIAEQGGTHAYFLSHRRNLSSLAMHERAGFAEITRDATYPSVPSPGGPLVLGGLALDPELPLRVGGALPSPAVRALYDAVGWTAYTKDMPGLIDGLGRSAWVITRWHGEQLVALCRVISDDATIVWIQDIIVHPDWQRRGLGRQAVELVLDRFRHVRQVQLLTDDRPEQHAFYASLGFTDTRDTVLHGFVRMG